MLFFSFSLRWSRKLADNLTSMIGSKEVTVFPYSVFYVFYEQYLTMWGNTGKSLAISAGKFKEKEEKGHKNHFTKPE